MHGKRIENPFEIYENSYLFKMHNEQIAQEIEIEDFSMILL
jgi:hypothetical protein